MAKLDAYSFKGDGVNLEFSFTKDGSENPKKIVFIGLMKQAIAELEEELGICKS